MQSGPFEYKNIKRLKVVYPEYDDKHEYIQPILCRARDMGKIIYGKWIIGGGQWSFFSEEPYSDDEEKVYIAYKLVGGARIYCNFELDAFNQIPFLKSYHNFRAGVEASRYYDVDEAINSYLPVCGEPETDTMECGMIYIKMPSGAEAKQTDGAAEEKSTDRPQILKGDIVRVVEKIADIPGAEWENCHFVSDVKWDGVFSDRLDFYYNTDIIAIYRFDGRDFKCIWESVEYQLKKFCEAFADAAESVKRMSEEWRAHTAALEKLNQYAKEVKEKASE